MKKMILSALIILFTIALYFSVASSVEKTARLQNNFNLDAVTYCVENELKHHNKTPGNLTSALNSCAKGQRSLGITGDIFVIRQSDKKLFWDASQDCKPEKETKLFMTEKGICSMFKEPETCLKATEYMIKNPPKGTLTWDFDDSTEFVDYRYLKSDIQGEKYIIGQGAQTDESNSMFTMVYVIIGIGGSILLLVAGL